MSYYLPKNLLTLILIININIDVHTSSIPTDLHYIKASTL